MKLLDWLVVSSADPQKLSTTVKGILISLLPIAAFLGGLPGITIPDQETLSVIINMIGQLVILLGSIVSALVAAYGLIRKIWRTWNGTNEMINLDRELDRRREPRQPRG